MTFEEWCNYTGQPFVTILERERCKEFFEAGAEQRDAEVAQLREACKFALSYATGEWDAVNRHPGSRHAEYVRVLSEALSDTAIKQADDE